MARPALSYCAEQVRRYDNDRFLCNLFAPEATREGLWSLHAFNIELARIRESVSQPLLGHIRLRWWMDTLDGIYQGRPPNHPVALALGETVRRFHLERLTLDRMIAGRAADLDDSAPADIEALIAYAEATSAAVFEAALEILGATGEETQESARDIGIAWALVGLVRAVPFHARSRRIYLPADLNHRAGLNVLARAKAHLQCARGRRHVVSRSALPVLLPATLADFYLDRLRRAGCNPFDPRVQAPSARRAVRLAIACWRQRY
jgi:NADH dehydrogenase [ubiquinone] 1 alpha subcomplex assembly factor 6